MTLLLIISFVACLLGTVNAGKDDISIADCGNGVTFKREQAWTCCVNVCDTDNSGDIDGPEIEACKSKYLYWYERALGWIVGPTKVSEVMKACDSNGDKKIDIDDYDAQKYYCMPYMEPLKEWKEPSEALCRIKSFCDRAAAILEKKVYT